METDKLINNSLVKGGGRGWWYIWSKGKTGEEMIHSPRGRQQCTTMLIYESST